MKEETGRQPSAPGKSASPKTLVERFSPLIALFGLIATALLGFLCYYQAQQEEIWKGRLNQAKEQLDIRTQELGKVKEDLQIRAEGESKHSLKDLVGPRPPRPIEVTVVKSAMAAVSDNLTITLTDVVFVPNPPRYRITAKVSYKGGAEMQIRDAAEGYAVTYPKEHGYTVEILRVDSASAKLSIKNNP